MRHISPVLEPIVARAEASMTDPGTRIIQIAVSPRQDPDVSEPEYILFALTAAGKIWRRVRGKEGWKWVEISLPGEPP